MTRVLLAEPDALLRAAARRRLAVERELDLVAAVGDADALRIAASELHPDVIVVDPTLDGLDPLLLDAERAVVVVWVERATPEAVAAMIATGAGAFLLKDATGLDALAGAVRAAAHGVVVVQDGAAPVLVAELLRARASATEIAAALEFAREALHAQVQELSEANASLELARESLAAQLDELLETYHETVLALASSVELRDEYTAGHIERVAAYSLALARALDPALVNDPSVFGYLLHDVGKLALPDSVLFNTGQLSPEQFEVVKSHTVEGARLVGSIPFLRPALAIVRNHHERWDGRGYPDGLAGEAIPPVVRVFTLADSLDAITTDRPYSAARPLDAAVEDIRAGAGSQFDPGVVAVFLELVERDASFALLRRGVVPAGGGHGRASARISSSRAGMSAEPL